METELPASRNSLCITKLSTTSLVGQPSCIAFSPDYHDLFVIGTYQLDQDSELSSEPNQGDGGQSQSRSGTVQLFRLEKNGHITNLRTHDLISAQNHDTRDSRTPGAVLDLRFLTSPRSRNTFAVCTSTGLIGLLELVILGQQSSNPIDLEFIQVFTPFTAETLLTCLSWNPYPLSQDEIDLAVTLSDGRVAVLTLPLSKNSEAKAKIQYIQALHSESAWIAQWCPHSQPGARTIATGGDDGVIHIITLPEVTDTNVSAHASTEQVSLEAEEEPQEALHSIDLSTFNKPPPSQTHQYDDRTHTAGVTAILPLISSNKALILVTGSYDNHIRILRPRSSSRRWETFSEADLGGGVWKLDLLSSDSSTTNDKTDTRWLVLASCMHAGVRIVELQRLTSVTAGSEEWSINILASFKEHTSMCYASAAMTSTTHTPNKQTWRVVSTSFYDRMVCTWEFTRSKTA